MTLTPDLVTLAAILTLPFLVNAACAVRIALR